MQGTIKSIEIALENELQERDFYLGHSRRTKNPVGKAMFEHIARDEEEHYQRLKSVHEQMTRTGLWPDRVSITVQNINILNVLLNTAARARTASPADHDDRSAVAAAIEFETKGYAFYSTLRDKASSEPEKTFFGQLASMEREHLDSLKDTLSFFEDPAAWFAQHEKTGLDG